MELSKEFITDNELTDKAVTAINGLNANIIADLKKEWDGKANSDAQAILEGAMKPVADLTGYARPDGQKIADFFSSAWSHHSKSKTEELSTLKSDYEEKIKSASGNEALTKEYDALKDKVENHYKKIEAEYEISKPFQELYETQTIELSNFKDDLAFNSNKPNFPDTVNEYESIAKWNEFKSEILGKYKIEIVDGVSIAIDKDNPHKTTKLKDLVSQNEVLNELLKERTQGGIKTKGAKTEEVEGVPFKIPTEATSVEIGNLVREHLTSKGVNVSSNEYSKQFGEIYSKIKNRQQTAA